MLRSTIASAVAELFLVRWQKSRQKTMQEGIIKTLTDKGYGFIASGSYEHDYFFRSNELQGIHFDELRCGDAVRFDFEASELGGRNALRIERAGDPVELTNPLELAAKPPAIVVRALQECTAELVQQLKKHPEVLGNLHPGTFENVIAEIFRHEGFDTERISGWNEPDGGVDLIAVRHLSPGVDYRLAVQCKRWAQSRRLSAEPIRMLAGVLDRFRAHAGVVATTGFFSRDAEEEMTSYLWRISLRDYNDILASLNRLGLTKTTPNPAQQA
jgi:cold shock CspA family protein